ncbi:cytochrome P450 78A7-like [Punica granatum]|uniref:Cytochrome P450 78A7-like n=2 Tax=Punica granatum TaxID=22663 RepID=A0A6P8DQ07_PUNGR|nr:cytochrome P450 78A7-like [Punica granatum]PKI76332.1 hypothetical protein CRG98_003254 [Punica granatum]
MEYFGVSKDTIWWLFTLPAFLGSETLVDGYFIFSLAMTFLALGFLSWAVTSGGTAWKNGRNRIGFVPVPGPRGLPIFGSLFALSRGLAHRTLAAMARSRGSTQLMAFSLGSQPFVVASDPYTAREILTSPSFADRPLKQSVQNLMFSRAIGFAPNGSYWRLLRRVAASHLFSPRRILAHEADRQLDCAIMIRDIEKEQKTREFVSLRKHLQHAALNNVMGSVFGRRYDQVHDCEELQELMEIVTEGFKLLGAFNWSDYLPWLRYFYDPLRVEERCAKLVPRVKKLIRRIIDQHRLDVPKKPSDDSDFVDVLLSLEGQEKLQEDDMIAVLWEMIFRGTDTTALLTEWVMAELTLNLDVQERLQRELDKVVRDRTSTLIDSDIAKLPYLQAVVKETLRVHPPGPLLSWARRSTSNVQFSNGMVVPANTGAMVNMWAIAHDPQIWDDPDQFMPERFLANDIDVKGGDLRLAPFGAGRRACPGKNLGLAMVALWVAELVSHFDWVQHVAHPVDLTEVLKLSCEMKHPLHVVAVKKTRISVYIGANSGTSI